VFRWYLAPNSLPAIAVPISSANGNNGSSMLLGSLTVQGRSIPKVRSVPVSFTRIAYLKLLTFNSAIAVFSTRVPVVWGIVK